MKRTIPPEFFEKRDKDLIKMINDEVSVSVVGKVFHITRERVCQIYFKHTGKSVRQLRSEASTKQQQKAEAYYLAHRPKCKQCGDVIKNNGRKFCSRVCHDSFYSNKREKISKLCTWCGVVFFPFYTAKYKTNGKNHFCKQKHYLLWRDKQLEPIRERNKIIVAMVKQHIPKEIIIEKFHLQLPHFYSILANNKMSILEMNAKEINKQIKNNK